MITFLRDWAPTLIAAGGVTILAFAGMMLTTLGPWYYGLRKPSWQPPDWLFGPAWTLIFVLEATSAVICWHGIRTKRGAGLLIGTYVFNGACNMLWSWLFFTRRRPDWAFGEVWFLWGSIVLMMLVVHHYAGPAWLFLVPYLLWVSFASYLTYTIMKLNGPFPNGVSS